SRSAATRRCTGAGASAGTAEAAETGAAGAAGAARAADAEATEVALTYGRAPRGLDLTGFLVGRDAVVDHDVGAGDTADRAVDVMDRRTRIGGAVPEIVSPLTLSRREVDRLGVHELRARHGVLDAHSEARVQQVRHRTGLP